ncbi:MAG TPA: alpha/beta family hydrolase [Thermoanaerobaculia bacterium]|nr:alpha/beta family hydrolase [Thermoanaerobaculia bacterium]
MPLALLVLRHPYGQASRAPDACGHASGEDRSRKNPDPAFRGPDPRTGAAVNPKPLRHVDLYSDAGRLEALYRDLGDPAAVAVVCHPLPTHGGTLHNKVVFRAARGLEAANVATLRFNFRGTGASQGKFEGGEGEQRDAEAAIAWMRKKHPSLPVIAGGFSFGGWVASRVGCDLPEVSAVFLLGAPINNYDLGYLVRCGKPKLFIQGTRDEFGDPTALSDLVTHASDAELILVERADHFFKGQLDLVEESLRQWAVEVLER